MKNDSENTDMQIMFDGFAQTLEEIRETVLKNPQSALTADLLNKIQQTIDHSKKAIDEEDLKRFLSAVINAAIDLREKSDKASAKFLNQKIGELRDIVKQPSVIINKYSIDFKSSKTFIVIIFLFFGIGGSLYFNYNQFQENKMLKTNDIKYRYVQMKGGVSYDDIVYLNKSYGERPQYRDSIKNNILEFESLVRQKVYNESVNNHNEKENKQIDKRLKELTK